MPSILLFIFSTSLPPLLHKLGVASKRGWEVGIRYISCIFNFHSNWVILQIDVVNAFNFVSQAIMFWEHVARGDIFQLKSFICSFYAFEPFFFVKPP
jgi:hypothetical protein